jgi:hypothetical protein
MAEIAAPSAVIFYVIKNPENRFLRIVSGSMFSVID